MKSERACVCVLMVLNGQIKLCVGLFIVISVCVYILLPFFPVYIPFSLSVAFLLGFVLVQMNPKYS